MNTQTFVGIDVSKKYLDVHILPQNQHFGCANTQSSLKKLCKKLSVLSPRIVVVEATGGYERALLHALDAASLPVGHVNPRQVRDFAKAKGILAKTDRIDARVIASFGEKILPPLRQKPDELRVLLDAYVTRREQLTEMIVTEKNRLHQTSKELKRDIRSSIKVLEKRVACIEEKIKKIIQSSPTLKQKQALLKSVPGVGEKISSLLLAKLGELGSLDRRKISALAGVAPFNNDSGVMRGKRSIRGGRHRVRSSLYMGVIVASRYNPVIQEFYQRLLEKGKCKKVALTACMRKLVVILNAMVKHNSLWQMNSIENIS